MYSKEILDLFNAMVITSGKSGTYYFDGAADGYITDFVPTTPQKNILREYNKSLDVTTLFTVAERENSSVTELLIKQCLHYIEVYGLDTPGLFNLEVTTGKVVTVRFVRGVTVEELGDMVRELLYKNAPVKDASVIKSIINHYKIAYDINKVANNELRVILFNPFIDRFTSGDDVVRYICYKATGDTLLIKSKEVISAVKSLKVDPLLLEAHLVPLAKVFNRHKPLILAAKNKYTKSVINKIGRMSKQLHEPIHEGINKRFVSEALGGRIKDFRVLDNISLRDKFKYLNLIEYKVDNNGGLDAFIIRNGKVHVEENRKYYDRRDLAMVSNKVISSIQKDLSYLEGKKILLDPNVDYGLPISRKQTLGNLPFGTTVTIDDSDISSGIYWENEWGARDLDLSVITVNGERVGWGSYSGYSHLNVIFSGDVTDAYNGAMEFMTSAKDYQKTYALFVNIFSGSPGSKAEIVVGNKTSDKWIEKPVLREKVTLERSGTCLGFVRNGRYVAYAPSINGNRISGSKKDRALVKRGDVEFYTVKRLFDDIGIHYDTERKPGVEYDYDLSYNSFSYDKLEELFLV